MTTTVFLAVIFAAVLHSTWNAILKHGTDKHLGMAAVVIGHLPFGIAVAIFSPIPAPASWGYVVTGICLHMGYQMFLIWSYRIGDLTQVYPIARGSAPLIVAAVSVTLLGVALPFTGIAGVMLIGAGLISLSLVRQNGGVRNPRAAQFAFVTGCFIAAYSINDGLGARAAGTALGYYAWESIGNAIVFGGTMAVLRPGLLRSLAVHADGRRALVIGGGASYLAYSIVTWAFTQAPIALVTALRETSIVFALAIGVVFLKERLDVGKAVATFMAVAGAIAIRLAR